jgi:hypothetical protein
MTSKRRAVAAFILQSASEAGIRIGTDGEWLDLLKPRSMTSEVWFGFERALIAYREEVIAIIQAEAEVQR